MSSQHKSRRSLSKKQPSTNEATATSSAATTSASTSSNQPAGLAAYVERKKEQKQARSEWGKKLADRVKKGVYKTHRPLTKSQKAGLVLPVQKILKDLKKLNPSRVVQEKAAVMTTGVIEYLCAEVLELAGNCTREFKAKRITPRHLFLAIKNDPEIDQLLKGTTIMQGGAIPNIHPSLLKTMPKSKHHHVVDTVDMSKRSAEEHDGPSPSKRSRN